MSRTKALAVFQPVLNQDHYIVSSLVNEKLTTLCSSIKQHTDEKLLIFPELIGAWFILSDQGFGSTDSVESIALRIICRSPISFLTIFIKNLYAKKFGLLGCFRRSLFQLRADFVLDKYYQTFSNLAIANNCWIVAGSAYLPRLRFENDKKPEIEDRSSLYNLALTFSPEGKVVDVAYKVHIIEDELGFVDPAPVESIHTFPCGIFGNVGVLICADSWFPACYKKLGKFPDVIAVPTFSSPASSWEERWDGYSGWPTPSDVVRSDVGSIGLKDAWRKYAVPGRTAGYVGHAFYQGSVLGLTAGGSSIIGNDFDIIQEASESEQVLYFTIPD